MGDHEVSPFLETAADCPRPLGKALCVLEAAHYAMDDGETGRKNNYDSGPFFIPSAGVVRKSNPRRPLWRGVNQAPTIYRPKGRKPVRGAKESFPGAKDALHVGRNQRRAKANQFRKCRIPTKIGENPYALAYALSAFAGSGAFNAYGQ